MLQPQSIAVMHQVKSALLIVGPVVASMRGRRVCDTARIARPFPNASVGGRNSNSLFRLLGRGNEARAFQFVAGHDIAFPALGDFNRGEGRRILCLKVQAAAYSGGTAGARVGSGTLAQPAGKVGCKTGNYLRMTGRYLRMAELSL